jgi:hypothetical protein
MNVTLQMNNAAYAELLAKVLPRPIREGREHERLTQMLLRLDERDDLTLPHAARVAQRIAKGAHGRSRIEA